MRSLSLVLLTTACTHLKEVPAADLGSSDLAVYRTVLDSMFVRRGDSRITQLVLSDSTTSLKGENLVAGLIKEFSRLPGVDTAAVRDLAIRSRERRSLEGMPRLGLKVRITLVNRQTLSTLPRENPDKYWSEFYQRYPGSSGSIELSAIGYSPNKDLAILMVDQGCGSLCGNGYVVALRWVAGGWRIAAIQQTWVS